MRFPIFMKTLTIDRTANIINMTHEDYPRRVDVTAEAIQRLVGTESLLPSYTIWMYVLRSVHAQVMHDCNHKGAFRTIDVEIDGERMPPPHLISSSLSDLCMVPISTKKQLEDWYEAFERLHPFEDGNGRVGGIMLAAISKMLFGHYMVAVWFDGTQREEA